MFGRDGILGDILCLLETYRTVVVLFPFTGTLGRGGILGDILCLLETYRTVVVLFRDPGNICLIKL